MQTQTITCAALSNDDNGISVSQTPAAGGAQELTITGALAAGGVAIMAAGQPVSIESAADETGRTFTVTGTDADGTACTDAITGADSATALGTVFFKTVTSISVDDDTAGAVYAGVLKADGGVSPTMDVNVGEYGVAFVPSLWTDVTTGTYTVEMTYTKINDTNSNGYSNSAVWFPITEFTAKTADIQANLTVPCHGLRMKTTTSTSGAMTAVLISPAPKALA